jgi:hypothetical protein
MTTFGDTNSSFWIIEKKQQQQTKPLFVRYEGAPDSLVEPSVGAAEV